MWGNLVTETAFLTNFTFGFPTKQSDILLHLTHWQYWFWFWFTYYMVLYYFIFLRLIRYRVMKMSPKLSTTFRSHGKWGDLIVCFIPLSWCTNILSNSNFILRMIEWQSESSLFTLRVRGKQWYWVYKFELKSLVNIPTTSLNIGHNYWVSKAQPQDHQYLSFLQSKHNLSDNHIRWVSSGQKQFTNNTELFSTNLGTGNANTIALGSVRGATHQPSSNSSLTNSFYWSRNLSLKPHANSYRLTYNNSNLSSGTYITGSSSSHALITRIDKLRSTGVSTNRLLVSDNLSGLELVPQTSEVFTQKPTSSNFYLVVKQKRYSPTSSSGPLTFSNSKMALNLKTFQNSYSPSTQNLAYRSEIMSLQSNRRLLRTKRVLVLPSHTNITLITNSFDVMHSWYVPGLGIKLDCVPGRSTHHTVHIDHAGFYYGQCAEICGRYHHHMPIRVCALPFEHFLVWWYHYGAPFFLAGNQDRSSFTKTTNKQLSW